MAEMERARRARASAGCQLVAAAGFLAVAALDSTVVGRSLAIAVVALNLLGATVTLRKASKFDSQA
jgi:hypothetical protein